MVYPAGRQRSHYSSPNIARHALSHRLWPGEPVKPTKPEKQNLISRLANRTYHYYKNLTFDYSSCSDEWADAISRAISLIKAQKTEIPARTMAVLTFLEICFVRAGMMKPHPSCWMKL